MQYQLILHCQVHKYSCTFKFNSVTRRRERKESWPVGSPYWIHFYTPLWFSHFQNFLWTESWLNIPFHISVLCSSHTNSLSNFYWCKPLRIWLSLRALRLCWECINSLMPVTWDVETEDFSLAFVRSSGVSIMLGWQITAVVQLLVIPWSLRVWPSIFFCLLGTFFFSLLNTF